MLNNPPRLQRLFEQGFELRGKPGYQKAPPVPIGTWHTEPAPCPDGVERFHWHASSISGCTRQQMLKRAKMPFDPKPLDSEITLAFGTMVHGYLEEFSNASIDGITLPELVFEGRVQHVGAE